MGNWNKFVKEFKEAFIAGDIEKLESLKKNTDDFVNINDLGGDFTGYGDGMDNWSSLIEEAKVNCSNNDAETLGGVSMLDNYSVLIGI